MNFVLNPFYYIIVSCLFVIREFLQSCYRCMKYPTWFTHCISTTLTRHSNYSVCRFTVRFATVHRHVIFVPEVRTSVFCWSSVTSLSSQAKCPSLSTTTNMPGLDPLTAILPSHTTDGINMMLQYYSYHDRDPATSQRDGITDSEACFPVRINQSGSSWSALKKNGV